MLPKKVKKRASLLTIFLLASVLGVFLILNTLNKNILYFNSPTEIKISEDIDFNKMTSCHIMSWKLGLKTGIYYFHTKPKSDAIKFTINENQFKKNDNDEDEGCLSCSA